ncbi:hypothetical protein BD410DRAFT_32305 [Rickenella mellea]|uniref:F-box domain-containing protein n=1 Tax=Rickenella mellea TaxID=50990 RepID=A0A4R5XH97_9AGAM|nr:hypothetical protein BD410DRAFT_32305 [Rickenella mellea]
MLSSAERLLYRSEPSENEVLNALRDISVHEDAIEELNHQASELHLQLRQIHEQKNKHAMAIRTKRGVLTMARRIPLEPLARIFEYCASDGWTLGPIVVSQVCFVWREAAKSPRVWSYIYIDCDRGNPAMKSSYWLRMAQQSSLHVTVRMNQYHPIAEQALHILYSAISNWTSFMLEVPSVQQASLVLAYCPPIAPKLKQVGIITADPSGFAGGPLIVGDDSQIVGLGSSFQHAPNLTSLLVASNVIQSAAGLPSQITSLSLIINLCQDTITRRICASEVIAVWQQCPNLEEFSMKVSHFDNREFEIDDPSRYITNEHLISLTLDLPSPYLTVIQHLRAPSLLNLYLRCPDESTCYADDTARMAMRTFIAESCPPLRLLELYDLDVSQEDFLFFFTRLPTLEEMRLHGSDILDGTLQSMCEINGLCPHLSKLDFRWCGHLTGSTLVHLVSSRNLQQNGEDTSVISEITIINCSFVNEKHILELAKYATCRLHVGDSADYCKHRGCCENARYRQRFRLRHTHLLTSDQRSRIRLG